MEDTTRSTAWDAASVAGACLLNLALVLGLALGVASSRDHDRTYNSGTPVSDGVLITMYFVLGLVVLNGVVLCFSSRTRTAGIGMLIGVVLTVPVGFVITLAYLASFLE